MFDATLLDELVMAPSSEVAAVRRKLTGIPAERIGAIIEYELYRRSTRPDLPSLESSPSALVRLIMSALEQRNHQAHNLSLQATLFDAVPIPRELRKNPNWTAFLQRVEATAIAANFSNSTAAMFAGAIGELADNIMQHSEATETGIAAFCSDSHCFEYAVGDMGIGILASLRKAPEFRSLRDDIEALPLAITPGVSRHGRGLGCGYGFRAVFQPLRAANGTIRLRSGAAVLVLEGYGPRPDIGRCSQRPPHQGVVVSVTALNNIL